MSDEIPKAAEQTAKMSLGKKIFILGALLLMTSSAMASYGMGVVLPIKMSAGAGIEFYPMINAIGTMGMMLALPIVGTLIARFGVRFVTVFGVILMFVMRLIFIFLSDPYALMAVNLAAYFGNGLFVTAPFLFISMAVLPQSRPKYFGLISTFNAVGALFGPVVVGVMADAGFADWGFIAYSPVIALAVVFAMTCFIAPGASGKSTAGASSTSFDFAGLLLMIAGICCVVLWLGLGDTLFPRLSIIGIAVLVLGIACLVGLVLFERKKENPAVPVYLFTRKRFTVSFICAFALASYTTAAAGYAIIYVQRVMQLSTTISSTVTIPHTLAMLILGIVVGQFLGKNFAKRIRPVAITSLFFGTVACVLLFLLKPDSSMVLIYVATALGGAGYSITQSAYTPFFQLDLKPEEYGAAQGLFGFAATSGAVIFSALAAIILTNGLSINYIFLIAVAFCAVGLLVGIFGFKMPRQDTAPAAAQAVVTANSKDK